MRSPWACPLASLGSCSRTAGRTASRRAHHPARDSPREDNPSPQALCFPCTHEDAGCSLQSSRSAHQKRKYRVQWCVRHLWYMKVHRARTMLLLPFLVYLMPVQLRGLPMHFVESWAKSPCAQRESLRAPHQLGVSPSSSQKHQEPMGCRGWERPYLCAVSLGWGIFRQSLP